MNWASIAILSGAILGIVNIIDSHLLSKRVPSFQAYLFPVGIIHFTLALIAFFLFPLPAHVSIGVIILTLISGLLRTTAITIMLYNLRRDEVSRVIPVVYTYPIFVAILAIPILGETLYFLQWLAIIIVVAGAVMASTRKSVSGSTGKPGKLFLLLIASSLCFAVADIVSKYVLRDLSFWNVFSLTAFCMSVTFLLISARPRYLSQIGNMPRRNSALALLAFNEMLAPLGITLSFWAMQLGPVSLVSTIIGSRPIYVVIFALVMSRLLPGFLDYQPGTKLLALRLAATVMIVGGIAIIYLT